MSYVEHVHCSCCGKRCSGVDPELGLVVRAWVECPECLEKSHGQSCAACRFWTSRDGSYGDCARTRADYRFRSDGDVTITGTLALAQADYDAAGYGAVLRTHANFACVQFTPMKYLSIAEYETLKAKVEEAQRKTKA
jgi:hypothetical protein